METPLINISWKIIIKVLFSNMAVCRSESKLLNETLTHLKTTSKGQLIYDPDWKITAEISNQLSCSFESFLNESTESLQFALSLDENEIDTSSENEDQSSVDDTTKKTSNSLGIPINFDVENERGIKQYDEECRGNVEERKAERARILERRTKYLKMDFEQKLRCKQEELAEEKQQFEIKIKELKEQDTEELRRRKAQLDEEAIAHKQRLDEILTRSLTEESLAAREREQRRAVLENLKKNVISLYHKVLRNIQIIEQKFADSNHMSFVDAQVSDDIAVVLHRVLSKAESVISQCEACDDLSDMQDHAEVMKKLIQATVSIDSKVANILKIAQEKAVAAAKIVEQMKLEQQMKLEEAKRQQQQEQQQKKLDVNKKPPEKVSDAKNEERTPIVAQQITMKESKKTTSHKFTEFISDKALVEYTELQEYLNKAEASFKGFISDPKHTKYKFELQKAVNIPINALSAHSPSQLNDKILRLVSLLSGDNVEVGGRRVNCKAHPSAMVS